MTNTILISHAQLKFSFWHFQVSITELPWRQEGLIISVNRCRGQCKFLEVNNLRRQLWACEMHPIGVEKRCGLIKPVGRFHKTFDKAFLTDVAFALTGLLPCLWNSQAGECTLFTYSRLVKGSHCLEWWFQWDDVVFF